MKKFKEKFVKILTDLSQNLGDSSESFKTYTYIINLAKNYDLSYSYNFDNLIITIPDFESPDEAPVVLQSNVDIDRKTDGTEFAIEVEDDLLKVLHTKGDIPFGLVFMLMLFDSYTEFRHPKIYLIFTKEKHNDFEGTKNIDVTFLEDIDYFINLNNRNENEIITNAFGLEKIKCQYHSLKKKETSGSCWIIKVENCKSQPENNILESVLHIIYHLTVLADVRLHKLEYKNDQLTAVLFYPVKGEDKQTLDDYYYILNLISESLDDQIKIAYYPTGHLSRSCYTKEATNSILWNLLFYPKKNYFNADQHMIGKTEITEIKSQENERLNFEVNLFFQEKDKKDYIFLDLIQYGLNTSGQTEKSLITPPLVQSDHFTLLEIYKNLAQTYFNLSVKEKTSPEPQEMNIFSYLLSGLQCISIGPSISSGPDGSFLDLNSAETFHSLLIKLLQYFSPEEDEETELTIIERTNGEIIDPKELFKRRLSDDLDS